MINEEYNKWLILYFDMQSINLQFNCNDIASSLKAQRDKIKQFCIDCLTGLTKGLYVNEAGTNTFMLIGNNMKSVSTDGGNNWTTSTLGEYTLTDLIYVDSNWYAIGSNGTKRLLLQNTASTFDQSNKILDLPDYSRQVIKINVQ